VVGLTLALWASACTAAPVTSPVYVGRSWICAPSDFLSHSAQIHMLPGTGFYDFTVYMYRGTYENGALPSLEFSSSGTGEAWVDVPFVPDPGKCMELVSWAYSPDGPRYTVTFTPEADASMVTTFYTYTVFHSWRGVPYP